MRSWWQKLIEKIKSWLSKPDPKPTPFKDAIDPGEINWLDKDVRAWKRVASLDMRRAGNDIVYDQTATDMWEARGPEGGEVCGNAWIFVKFDGEWCGATNEYFRPGQKHKGLGSVTAGGGHIPHRIFEGWNPAAGEQYGFMCSTLCRGSATNGRQRTQITLYTWQ